MKRLGLVLLYFGMLVQVGGCSRSAPLEMQKRPTPVAAESPETPPPSPTPAPSVSQPKREDGPQRRRFERSWRRDVFNLVLNISGEDDLRLTALKRLVSALRLDVFSRGMPITSFNLVLRINGNTKAWIPNANYYRLQEVLATTTVSGTDREFFVKTMGQNIQDLNSSLELGEPMASSTSVVIHLQNRDELEEVDGSASAAWETSVRGLAGRKGVLFAGFHEPKSCFDDPSSEILNSKNGWKIQRGYNKARFPSLSVQFFDLCLLKSGSSVENTWQNSKSEVPLIKSILGKIEESQGWARLPCAVEPGTLKVSLGGVVVDPENFEVEKNYLRLRREFHPEQLEAKIEGACHD